MIVHECEQGTPEWHALRLGLPTSSNFHRLVTAKRLEPSAAADGYLHELLAAWLIGEPTDTGKSAFMERGTGMEESARDYLSMVRDAEVRPVGFITRDDGMAGASTDGLIGDDGVAEIKCPSAAVHVSYLVDPPSLVAEYRLQVFGELLITERAWCDVLSYNPYLPPVLIRVQRDESVISALRTALDSFVPRLVAARAHLISLGCVQRKANAAASEAALMGSF